MDPARRLRRSALCGSPASTTRGSPFIAIVSRPRAAGGAARSTRHAELFPPTRQLPRSSGGGCRTSSALSSPKLPALVAIGRAVQATSLEHAPRYPWGDLTFEPECRRAQRRTDRRRNIAAGQHQPSHLTAHLRCGDDLSQPGGDDVPSPADTGPARGWSAPSIVRRRGAWRPDQRCRRPLLPGRRSGSAPGGRLAHPNHATPRSAARSPHAGCQRRSGSDRIRARPSVADARSGSAAANGPAGGQTRPRRRKDATDRRPPRG